MRFPVAVLVMPPACQVRLQFSCQVLWGPHRCLLTGCLLCGRQQARVRGLLAMLARAAEAQKRWHQSPCMSWAAGTLRRGRGNLAPGPRRAGPALWTMKCGRCGMVRPQERGRLAMLGAAADPPPSRHRSMCGRAAKCSALCPFAHMRRERAVVSPGRRVVNARLASQVGQRCGVSWPLCNEEW
jgi:hypothetical protein